MAGPRKQAETAFVPTLDERLNNEFGDSNESVRVPDDAVFRDLESCLDPQRRWYWYIELAGLRWLDDESVPWNDRCRTAILRARSRFESGTIHSAFSDLRTAISLAVSNGNFVEGTKQVFQASVNSFESAVTSACGANAFENCIRLGAEWLHLVSEFPCLDIEISDTALKAIATSEKESGSTCAIASVLSINKGIFGLCRTVVRFARGESPWRDETSSLMRELIRKATDDSQYGKIVGEINAEIDARVRSEEAEQARRNTWREYQKAVAATRDMLALVASIRETWNTRPLSLGEALDASAIPGEAKFTVLDAWRSWKNARSVESDGNAALDKMERELAALPDSPERTTFDEAGIELHPVDGVPGIFDVAAALNARGDRMREFADWENDEPKLDDVPVPNTARPSIPEDADLKRHATENVLSAASRPVAFLFRNAKYWAIVGGVLFLAFWWIPPLGRWAYGENESVWRGAFWLFIEFVGPLFAFVWRRHREEIERMRLYSERADKTVGERLSELERTHSASGDLTELLAELSKKRSWAKSVTKDSIRIVKETQGFRTLPDWLSDAEERCKKAKTLFHKKWEDVLDAVAAATTLEDRKSELARRTAVWRERGETLAARRRETFELLQSAVESTRRQIAAKRKTLETATKSAAATVDAALSAFSAWTETADSKAEKARAVAEGAIREATKRDGRGWMRRRRRTRRSRKRRRRRSGAPKQGSSLRG